METDSRSEKNRFSLSEHAFSAPNLEPALYIVSTPIGNLGDITVRALETLAASSMIACEDTRVTSTLTQKFGLKTPLLPYHEHNAEKQRPRILAELEAGKAVALVSDAGTPLVSDPGYRLVRGVLEAGFRVIPIPGASAPLAGLVASGLPSDTVLFAGFLPQKGGPKSKRLQELASVPATLVFFESPHRTGATLEAMAELLGGNRDAVVARELTKRFETFERGSLSGLAQRFEECVPVKGEIVILVGPPEVRPEADASDMDALLKAALEDMPVSAAAKKVAKATGLDRGRGLQARAGPEIGGWLSVTRHGKQSDVRRRAHALGLSAESRAAWYLRLTGWRILKHRYKTRAGEIDLIAKKRKTVAFIEVKARKTRQAAMEAVTPASQERISRAAKIFVSEHPKAGFFALRFDVIIIRPWALPERIENAFQVWE